MHHKRDRTYRILIVDDGKDFREALRDFLVYLGYQVQEASDGRKALDLLRKSHGIDLVLLDINMPRLHGVEILAQIRKMAPELNVIIVTGHCTRDIMASLPEGHVQGCIEKTENPDKIKKIIEKTLKIN
jgi:DNA-binding NtrC family response regulator